MISPQHKTYDSKLRNFLIRWTSPPGFTREDGIRYWQDRLLFTLLFAGVVLGAFVYFPSVALCIKEKLWSVGIADTIIYIWIIVLFFRRSIPFAVRASTFIIISYILGMVLLLTIGPFGAGPVWLFAFPVIAGLLLGLQSSLIALSVNAVTIILMGLLIASGHLEWDYATINAPEKWTVISLNFMLLNSVVSISVAVFSRGLQTLLEQEKSMLISLEQNHAELLKSNRQLEREMRERKRAEEDLRRSLERLQVTMKGAIQAIAVTVEIRDPYTAGHQLRVADLSSAIAKELGFSKEQTEEIYLDAAVHDIGKIALPVEFLVKPGQLSEMELELFKPHAEMGYKILKPIGFPWPIAQVVLQHHERMDGSGYPRGLAGEEIVMEARILGVADTVEAMASDRPYRPALGIDKALEEIQRHRGVLYDPAVVDACLKLFTEKGFEFTARGT
ncbi:MAG: HD-GYP domain-containing protein [Desulfobacteraceae bacterium]|nr:HD-GYP domain-containing protein [Desulfobacteraceae bacterium]